MWMFLHHTHVHLSVYFSMWTFLPCCLADRKKRERNRKKDIMRKKRENEERQLFPHDVSTQVQ